MRGALSILLACAALAQEAQPPEPESERDRILRAFAPYEGKGLAGVVIDCDTSWCTDVRRKKLLLRVTRLRPHRPLSAEAVAGAWEGLVETTYFRRLAVRPVEGPRGVYARFEGVGSVIVSDVEIEYATLESRFYPQQFEREIRKRMRLRQGGNFPPRYGEDPDAFLVEQTELVRSLYERRGYAGTKVEIRTEFHGRGGKEVRVVVVVDEGRQPPMGSVLLRGNESRSYAEVTSPVTTGERYDFGRGLWGIFGVGRYAERRLREEVDEVERTYREQGWVAARVRLEEPAVRRGVWHPRVSVREGPRVEVEFVGNESIGPDDLAQVVTFKESGAYDETEIEASEAEILAAYQSAARYYARVTHEVRTLDDGKRVLVRFHIEEGPRVYVRAVRLRGATVLPRSLVLGVMETQGVAADGVIGVIGTSAGVVQDARLINDLIRVRELYQEQGFASVRFRCANPTVKVEQWTAWYLGKAPRPEGHPDVWSDDPVAHRCYAVEKDETDERLVYLHLEVAEGPRTVVGRVQVDDHRGSMDGRTQDALDSLMQNIGFRDELEQEVRWAGLNRRKIDAVSRFLREHYRGQGYLAARVRGVCEGEALPADADDVDTCAQGLLVGQRVDRVRFKVELGPQTVVDGVLLRGNLRTRDSVIRGQLVLEDGGAYSDQGLSLSTQNLRTLGTFESVRISRIHTQATRTDRVQTALLVDVEEGSDVRLDSYVGLQLDQSLIEEGDVPLLYELGLTIRDRNLFGRAFELGLGGKHGNRVDTPQDVKGDDATWEAGPFFRDRRLFGSRIDLLLEPTFKRGRTPARDEYEQVLSAAVTLGYDFFNLSYPSDWGRGLRGTLRTQYAREERRELEKDGRRPQFDPPVHSLGIQPALTWDRRDNPLHPTRGWLVALTTETVFSSDQALPELSRPSFKETLAGQYVRSFFKRQLIVAPSLRLGAVQTDQQEEALPSGFLFKAGGDGVALPVRGYSDASIDACRGLVDDDRCREARGPYEEYDPTMDEAFDPQPVGGRAMALGSLEVRFPTFLFDDFWWAVFGDVAAVAPGWSEMSWDRFYPSVGGGLRWLLTGQIPIRIDVGFPLRETEIEPQTFDVVFNIFYPL